MGKSINFLYRFWGLALLVLVLMVPLNVSASDSFARYDAEYPELYPVPEAMDFPEYGIYNVTIPEGFSVFTKDEDFVTKDYYKLVNGDFSYLHQSFEENPNRVARIINNDHSYEIDIKAYPVDYQSFDRKLFTMPKLIAVPIYTFYNYSLLFKHHDTSRGFLEGKYGFESFSEKLGSDYRFHLFDFLALKDDQYYKIDYHFNSYYGEIEDEMDEIFLDTIRNFQVDSNIIPGSLGGMIEQFIYYFKH